MLALRKTEENERPYTIRMSLVEERLLATVMVMINIGEEKEIWNTCSHMCAGHGLNEEQSRRVVAAAFERAKRKMGY